MLQDRGEAVIVEPEEFRATVAARAAERRCKLEAAL